MIASLIAPNGLARLLFFQYAHWHHTPTSGRMLLETKTLRVHRRIGSPLGIARTFQNIRLVQ